MIVAIIPARKNSKRVKRKNIKIFFGKPMIYWTIRTLKKTKIFDKIYVSTDCPKTAKISIKYGAEVPFLRSKNMSDDNTHVNEVVKNYLDKIIKINKKKIMFTCVIYPTTPLLNYKDLIKSFKILKKNYNYVFSVMQFVHPIQRGFYLNRKFKPKMINKKYYFSRSQDLKKTYHDAGQFYWGKTESFLKNKPLISEKTFSYILKTGSVVDIDEPEDFDLAKKLFKARL